MSDEAIEFLQAGIIDENLDSRNRHDQSDAGFRSLRLRTPSRSPQFRGCVEIDRRQKAHRYDRN